jgi:hypothetical protein
MQPIENIKGVLREAKSLGLKAQLTRYATARFSNSKDFNEQLITERYEHHMVLNSGTWFESTLCKDAYAQIWMEKAFMSGRKMFLVVSYITLRDAEATTESHERSEMTLKGNVPVGEISQTGQNSLDVSLEVQKEKEKEREVEYRVPGKAIFAIEFREIIVKFFSSKTVDNSFLKKGSRWFFRLTEQGSAGDDEDDEEDIMDVELSPEDVPSSLSGCGEEKVGDYCFTFNLDTKEFRG